MRSPYERSRTIATATLGIAWGAAGLLAAAVLLLGPAAREVLPPLAYLFEMPFPLLACALVLSILAMLPRPANGLLSAATWIVDRGARKAGSALVLSLFALSLFWLARSRNLMLGDGSILVQDIPYDVHVYGQNIWPDEILARFTRSWAYRLGHTLLGLDIVQSFALSSALWGIGYFAAVIALARELFQGCSDARAACFLFFAACAIVQVFFGYVEVYSGVCVMMIVYARAALRYLSGRGSIAVAGACLALAAAFHLMALSLLPTLGLIVLTGREGEGGLSGLVRRASKATLGAFAIAAAVALLYFGILAYDVDHAERSHAASGRFTFTVEESDPDFQYRAFDLRHLRDLVLINARVAPAALGALLLVLLLRRRCVSFRDRSLWFALVYAGCLQLFTFVVHPDLGPIRDWDLLSVSGLGYSLLGAILFGRSLEPSELRRTTVPLAALGIFFTATFVLHNATVPEPDYETLRADDPRWWITSWGIEKHRAKSMHEFAHLAAAERRVGLALGEIVKSRPDLAGAISDPSLPAALLAEYRARALPEPARKLFEAAVDDYREALVQRDDNALTHRKIAHLLEVLKRPSAEVADHLRRVLELEPDAPDRRYLESVIGDR